VKRKPAETRVQAGEKILIPLLPDCLSSRGVDGFSRPGCVKSNNEFTDTKKGDDKVKRQKKKRQKCET